MSKNHKICPKCNGKNIIKKGKKRGIQTYQCKDCKKYFSSKRRKHNIEIRKILKEYIFHKQTYREMKEQYHYSKQKLHNILRNYKVKEKIHNPRKVHLIVDTIWFGSKKNNNTFCVIVFRSEKEKENLYFSIEKQESKLNYFKGRKYLEQKGYTILSVTGDGFRGIKQAFQGIPYQMCHIHMERIVIRNTTRKPQTEAGQVLLALVKTLTYTNKKIFFERLRNFTFTYQDFLKEKTINPETGKWFYTHKRVRSAWKSLLFFSEDLFTYEKDKEIPKNTNSLEGHFSHVRDLMNIHRSLSFKLKVKILYIIFLASTTAPTKEKIKEIL